MISPRKIKSYTRLAMMKATHAQKILNDIEPDTLAAINENFNSINATIEELSNAINSLKNIMESTTSRLENLNLKSIDLTQRVEALESI